MRRTPRLVPVPILLLSLFVLPIASSNATAPREAHGVRALFFGDSLMAGAGAHPTRPVMARIAARALGWDITVDAWGGTGFTTGGARGKSFLARLSTPGLLAPHYDVVLIEGGTNDRAADPSTVRRRADQAVRYVHRRQPGARIVLMGAFDPPGRRSDPRRVQVDRAIAEVAQDHGLLFVSPITGGWAKGRGSRFLSADGLHPSAYGYGVMGARLVDALRRVEVGRPSG